MKRYYGAINGIRTIATFGIIMMHIQANNKYKIGEVIYNTIIHSQILYSFSWSFRLFACVVGIMRKYWIKK